MKWSFDIPTLVMGGLQIVNQTAQQLKEAETDDGKIDKKELATIALSALTSTLAVLAAASRVDGKPVLQPEPSDEGPGR